MKLSLILAGILAAATIQTGLVGKMITDRAAILRNGTEVRLETGFVDPRDLFRGHYVALRLDISEIQMPAATRDHDFEIGEPVWVEIEPDEDGFWRPVGLRVEPAENLVTLRGTMSWTSGDAILIDFPFDRYFAPKLRAKELENLRRDGKLGIALSVLPDGEAAVKGIVIDGEAIYDEPLY